MMTPRPPKALESLLERTLPAGLSTQGTLGDLAEEYGERARRSTLLARWWYLRQTVSILAYRARREPTTSGSETPSDLAMDVRWSLRSIIRHPGFAFGVVAVLGLGLGVNAGVFAVVDGTLGNTSGWQDPDRTVAIWPGNGFSQGQLQLYDQEQQAYRSVGGYVELAFALQTQDGESQSVNGVVITPELFRELDVQPVIGRPLSDDDALLGTEAVVVIGNALWQRSFGGNPDVVGQRIDIGGASVTVVGVQGPGALAPGGRAELWFPLVPDPRDDDFWKAQSYTMIGALRDGTSLDDGFEELMGFTDLLSTMFPMFYPRDFARGIATVALADQSQRELIATPLLLLLAGTGLLMLVTALNVGNLLLGRAIERRRELAIRASLGAGRGRIVRQLLVEGLVLTAVALTIGLVTASFSGDWIASLFVEQAIVSASPILSRSVILFSLALASAAWLVLNGVPIAYFLRTGRDRLTASSGGSRTGTRRALVTAQAALATLLLVSATLLIATVDNLRSVPLGFQPEGIVTLELSTPADQVETASMARSLYDGLLESVEGVPGVQAAGLTGWLPLRKQAPPTPINLESDPRDPREAVKAPMHMVDPGFFEAMGVGASEGRVLGSLDREDLPSAVVVNESLAEILWPGGNAVGQRIAVDPHDWYRFLPVVGVVPDVRSGAIRGPTGPALYVALAESPARDVTMVIRASGDPSALVQAVRRRIVEAAPLVPIRSIAPMADVVRAAYSTSWVMMGLLVVLAFLATALGAVGIYAVLTQHVALSRRELGVRMALGAQPSTVVGGVIRSGLVLSGIGIAIGCIVAAMSTRLLESLLYEVSALTPWAFLAPAAALAMAALLAAWLPAARAGSLPPADVLRSD